MYRSRQDLVPVFFRDIIGSMLLQRSVSGELLRWPVLVPEHVFVQAHQRHVLSHERRGRLSEQPELVLQPKPVRQSGRTVRNRWLSEQPVQLQRQLHSDESKLPHAAAADVRSQTILLQWLLRS